MATAAKTSDTRDQPAEAPHYKGHRVRLRERFQNAGPDGLSDNELLEMALFTAQPRDKRNQLISDEVQQTDTVDHAPAYPREVIKRVLELSATSPRRGLFSTLQQHLVPMTAANGSQ